MSKNKKNEASLIDEEKYANQKLRQSTGTELVGTNRYNPFIFDFSNREPTKTGLQGTNNIETYLKYNYELHLVNGWFNIRKADSTGESVSTLQPIHHKRRIKMADLFKLVRMPQRKVNGRIRLSTTQIEVLNRVSTESIIGRELTGKEICKIEDQIEHDQPGRNVNCFRFIRNMLRLFSKELGNQTNFRVIGECILCKHEVTEVDQLTEEEGNLRNQPIHVECVKCELSRQRVTTIEAIRQRQNREACLSEKSKRQIAKTKSKQANFHSRIEISMRKEKYLQLFPPEDNKFVPIIAINCKGMTTRGIIPMCFRTGLQLKNKDEMMTNESGQHLLARQKLEKKLLKQRFQDDMITVAIGLEDTLILSIQATSSVLNTPIERCYTFKKSMDTLNFELNQNIKSSISLIYYLDKTKEVSSIKSNQVLTTGLIFSGMLIEDFGAFFKGLVILRQGCKMKKDKHVSLYGRYKHGILYTLKLDLLVNSKDDGVTPVSFEVQLRVP